MGNMNDVEQRVAALCASPTGCVFLLFAEAAEFSPEAVADPVVAVQIAAQAVGETISFQTYHGWIVPTALDEGSRLLPFARAILEQPAAEEWFTPLNRDAQEWIGPTGTEPLAIVGAAQVSIPPSAGELIGQEPLSGVVTSTGVGAMSEELEALIYDDGSISPEGGRIPHPLKQLEWRNTLWPSEAPESVGFGEMSSAVSALIYHSGDYELGAPPLVRYRLRAAADLRVFEVVGPESWHALCVRYPARGQEGRLVPDWGSFVQGWDAVHLTLGGLLTADQVTVESEAGWTKLELWEFEHTHWLRWRFETIERMPDITGLRGAPLWLPDPPALEPPPGVRNSIALEPQT